jgi:hypothetical protein
MSRKVDSEHAVFVFYNREKEEFLDICCPLPLCPLSSQEGTL